MKLIRICPIRINYMSYTFHVLRYLSNIIQMNHFLGKNGYYHQTKNFGFKYRLLVYLPTFFVKFLVFSGHIGPMILTMAQNIPIVDRFRQQMIYTTNYGFQAIGNHIWLQNIRFCVFYPLFSQSLAFFGRLCRPVRSNHGAKFTFA